MSEGYTQKELLNELRKEVKGMRIELTEVKTLQTKQLEQQKIANGRTAKNEDKISVINTKMAYIYGGIALLSALGVSNLVTWAGI